MFALMQSHVTARIKQVFYVVALLMEMSSTKHGLRHPQYLRQGEGRLHRHIAEQATSIP